jgi:methenyltetrahydromethanopterin cyclohydrolase
MLGLNELAWKKCNELAAEAERLSVVVSTTTAGTRVIDCGVKAVGGLEAGRRLAEICLAGMGIVEIATMARQEPRGSAVPGRTLGPSAWPVVTVRTDQPVVACLAAQYAGWQITGEKFFAMGSGPMRAAGSREPLFDHLGYREKADRVVGVLETGKLPTEEICEKIAKGCGVAAKAVTLLVARTASMAGTVQIVARSVETALHKLHTIGYEVKNVVSGMGSAPLPPVAADDLVGIGRTNDAVLYGGEVTLWVRDDDAKLAEIGRRYRARRRRTLVSRSRRCSSDMGAIFIRSIRCCLVRQW